MKGMKWPSTLPRIPGVAWAAAMTMMLASACADPRPIHQDTAAQIQPNAQVIVLEQAEPPLDVYNQALLHLQEAGYAIEQADEEALQLTTAPIQVGNDLAIRLNMRIAPEAGMSRLSTTAEWAAAPTATTWSRARWGEGRERTAFEEALAIVAGIPHERLLTRVE
jgi:hypothetical protein